MSSTQDIYTAPVEEFLGRIAPRSVGTLVITGHDQPGNAGRVKELAGVACSLTQVNEVQLLENYVGRYWPWRLSRHQRGRKPAAK